jgi:hypothetical protein
MNVMDDPGWGTARRWAFELLPDEEWEQLLNVALCHPVNPLAIARVAVQARASRAMVQGRLPVKVDAIGRSTQ